MDVLGHHHFDEYGNIRPLQREHLSLQVANEQQDGMFDNLEVLKKRLQD